MRASEEIVQDVLKNKAPSEDYKSLELQCFLEIKNLLSLYKAGQYTKAECTKMKQQILVAYSNEAKQQEFWESIYKEHIQHIKDTENARIKLHKMLNGKDEYNRPITEDTLCETINTCMEIISTIFKGEFI